MKRSTCLSALLVGLSLTAASVAFAAPTETGTKKATRVAQAAPAAAGSDAAQGTGDPAPSDQTGTAPTTAPASPDGAGTTQPAVSIGTAPSTPGTDQPQTAAPEPAKKPKPRPFAGSALYNQNSVTTGTIFRGQTQDYNPTSESTLWFLPRYALNDAFQLRGRLILSYEYTNSDDTRYRNEPLLSDTTISLFYRKLPKLPLGIQPNVAFNLAAPTSKVSRARTMVVSPGATLQLARPFEHILGGEGMILSSLIFSHPFYTSRVGEVVDPRAERSVQCAGGGGDCNNLFEGGALNPANTLSYFALFEVEWGKFAPAVYYLGGTQWLYAPKEVSANDIVPGSGNQPIISGQSKDPPEFRQTHYFSAWLDYNFNSWFTGEVGYWNSQSAVSGSGQIRGPHDIVFNRYGDTRVYLGASIQLDNLVKTIQGGNEGEAGVVRAKNRKTPMWTF